MARNRTRNKTINNSIKILSETPANRCEICHKSDEYDSELNTCNRCDGVSLISLIDDDWTRLNDNQPLVLPELNSSELDSLTRPLSSQNTNHNPNRINISRNNTLLADRPNPSNPFNQSEPPYEVSQTADEIKALDDNPTLEEANKVDDGTDELEEMDKLYPSYESVKGDEVNEVNEADKLYNSTGNKPFNEFVSQLKPSGKFNYRPILVGLMAIVVIICIFFSVSSSYNSKSPSLYDITVKNGKIIKDEVLTINTEISKTDSVETENTSSTEVEEIPYQLDLSLASPQDNSYVTLAVDGVTVIESDEPILKVINGSESLAIEQSSFPTKKLYLIGKDTLDSGNLILITKTSVFSLYYEIRTDAIPGNFNILVKIKKQTNTYQ